MSSDPSSESFFYCLPPLDIVSLVEDLSKRALLFFLRTLFYFPWMCLWVSSSLWEVRYFLWREVVWTKGRCRVEVLVLVLVRPRRGKIVSKSLPGVIGKTLIPRNCWQDKSQNFDSPILTRDSFSRNWVRICPCKNLAWTLSRLANSRQTEPWETKWWPFVQTLISDHLVSIQL